MGKSKGGSTSSATEIPAWLENAAIENINKARDVSQIGYTPYYGADVAAFSPMQEQAMRSTGGAASAFGLAPQGFDAMAGMPEAQTFAGGVRGYSSAPMYEESLAQLQANRPAQYEAITGMFIDPITGEMTGRDYRTTEAQRDQMINRAPATQPDYAININNTASGGSGTATGGTGGLGGVGGATYDSIYNQAEYGDLVGGDTFVGDNGNTYTVGYGEGQVDHGLANAVRDKQIEGANNSLYNQAASNDLVGGDTFTGDDGNYYTAGYDEGQVDHGLANAVRDSQAATTTPYDMGGVTSLPSYEDLANMEPDGFDLGAGLTPSVGSNASSVIPPISSSGVVDPLMSNMDALGNIATTVSPTLGLIDSIFGDKTAPPVSELSNEDALPMDTGLFGPNGVATGATTAADNAYNNLAVDPAKGSRVKVGDSYLKTTDGSNVYVKPPVDSQSVKAKKAKAAKAKAAANATKSAKAKAQEAVQKQLEAEKVAAKKVEAKRLATQKAKAQAASKAKAEKAKAQAAENARINAEAKRIADALEKQAREIEARKKAQAAAKKAQVEAAAKKAEAQRRKAAADKRAKAQAAKERAEAAAAQQAQQAAAARAAEAARSAAAYNAIVNRPAARKTKKSTGQPAKGRRGAR